MQIYILYMLLVVFLYLLLKPNKYKNNNKLFVIITYIILLLISCLRNLNVGVDTEMNCDMFEIISSNTLQWSFTNLRSEHGFIIFCKLLSIILNNSQILIIMSSFVIITSVFYFIYKNSENTFLSIILFICLNYYFSYMNIMRQALAISIVLIGYTLFYKNNNNFAFLFTIILAAFFHKTILVLVVVFWISSKLIYNKTFFGCTILISIIAFLCADKVFLFLASGTQYKYYIGSRFSEGSNIAGYLNYIVALVMLIFSYIFAKDKIKKDFKFNNYFFILSVNLILLALSIKVTIFGRLSTYFNIYNIIYLPKVVNNVKIISNKNLIKIFMYIVVFVYWIIIAYFRPEWYGCIPYKWFFI